MGAVSDTFIPISQLQCTERFATMFAGIQAFVQAIPPEAALFFVIGVGFYIGRIKFGFIQLGGVCGTLIAALAVGQIGLQIDPAVKIVFFAIFIFALGYIGGPQLFANLNAKSLRLGVLSLIEIVVIITLVMTYVFLFSFDPGTAAGLVAGSATESAIIGTASEAISRLNLSAEEIHTLQSHVVAAYSVTYVFGLTTIVLFTSQLAPLLLKANLRQQAEKLWVDMGGSKQQAGPDLLPVVPHVESRAYVVDVGTGKRVAEIDKLFNGLAHIESIRRRGRNLAFDDSLALKKDDLVLLAGYQAQVMRAGSVIGRELAHAGTINMKAQAEEYLLSNRELGSLQELQDLVGAAAEYRGVYVAAIKRNGHSLPLVPDLKLANGDILNLYGDDGAIAALGAKIGKKVQKTAFSNFVYVSIGLLAGILIGQIHIPVGGISLSLGSGPIKEI